MVEFQDGFIWPLFDINNTVLTRIGLGALPPNVDINLFRPHLNLWTVIPLDHVIQLTPENTRIFLKPSNVDFCKNLVVLTSEIRDLIGRIDVKHERAYMKSRLRQEELEHALAAAASAKRSLSFDSVIVHPPPPKRFCKTTTPILVPQLVKDQSAAMTRIKKRKKTSTIYIYSSSDDQPASKSDALDDSEDTDGPEPFSSPLRRGTSSQKPFTPSRSAKALWPGERSIKEVVEGFIQVDDLSKQPDYTVTKAFEEHFGMKFSSSTFYEHRDRWNNASQEDRDAGLASNQSWASFVSRHPFSRASVKAARKRQQKHLRRHFTPNQTSLANAEDDIEFVD